MSGRAWTDRTHATARDALLEALAEGGSVTAACERAGVAKSTAYAWKAGDPEFGAAWDEALDSGADVLEDEAHRRAVTGVEEPVVAMGRVAKNEDGSVLTIRRYSDGLLQTLLKAKRPEKYRERHLVDANLSGKVELEHTADEDFLAVAAALGGHAARPASGAGDDGGLESEGKGGPAHS